MSENEAPNTENQETTPAESPQPEAEASTAPAATEEVTLGGAGDAEIVAESTPSHTVPSTGLFWGLGRRKTSVARVRLIPGKGEIKINKRDVDTFFTEEIDREAVTAPLKAVKALGSYNVYVNVKGGGHTGQAGAIRLGVARALVAADGKSEPLLRDAGYLTRDARKVERKKYGHRKARRRFQFSKR